MIKSININVKKFTFGYKLLHMKIHLFFVLILCCVVQLNFAQYKSFSFSAQGDTINIIDSKGLKQGKWVITVGELRGEPGYVEEGIYAKDKKEGYWRRYSIEGDLLSVENYKYGLLLAAVVGSGNWWGSRAVRFFRRVGKMERLAHGFGR